MRPLGRVAFIVSFHFTRLPIKLALLNPGSKRVNLNIRNPVHLIASSHSLSSPYILPRHHSSFSILHIIETYLCFTSKLPEAGIMARKKKLAAESAKTRVTRSLYIIQKSGQKLTTSFRQSSVRCLLYNSPIYYWSIRKFRRGCYCK